MMRLQTYVNGGAENYKLMLIFEEKYHTTPLEESAIFFDIL